ncbi:hypothetical protein H7170_02365 [Candidatus Gracilibacteria bacterium]|nr:hypothetical protein [Candidatus Gracilibacteria bacterium]
MISDGESWSISLDHNLDCPIVEQCSKKSLILTGDNWDIIDTFYTLPPFIDAYLIDEVDMISYYDHTFHFEIDHLVLVVVNQINLNPIKDNFPNSGDAGGPDVQIEGIVNIEQGNEYH